MDLNNNDHEVDTDFDHDYQDSSSTELPEDGLIYDPENYKKLKEYGSWDLFLQIFGFIGFGLFGFGVVNENPEIFVYLGGAIFVFTIFAGLASSSSKAQLYSKHRSIVIAKKREEEVSTMNRVKETVEVVQEMKQTIEQSAKEKGDIIIQHNKSPVIIDSTIVNSFNKIKPVNPELAEAIKNLGGFIENSGNQKAANAFDKLHAEVSKDAPDKTIVEALWDSICTALPHVQTLLNVTKTIKDIFT